MIGEVQTKDSCLVIGANGFIGSHLVDMLSSKGYPVVAFDKFSSPPKFNGKNTTIFKGNFFNETDLSRAATGVSYVFHSFSATTPYSSDNDPYQDIDLNLKQSVKLFEICTKKPVKKVIFISSGGAVYGPVSEERLATEADATSPVSPYGISKLAIENYLAYFNRKYELDYQIFRLTNPYGPRQVLRNNQGVIPAFLARIAKGQDLVIFGDGTTSRDYIYIQDAITMIINVFDKATNYKTYNIGTGIQHDLTTIAELLQKNTHKNVRITYKKAPRTFLQKTQVSIDRYCQEFGRPQFTSLEAGIKLTLKNRDQ